LLTMISAGLKAAVNALAVSVYLDST